ncbi:MAG: alcohol dehydrogenase catalytic domain-containing protein [Synergistaceae bacterium]|nr:alcohol dehydrogenase catalytic domain-containing protein [Synergistaceae bacterium]
MDNYSIPEKMKAVVLTAPGQFEIQEVPVPVPGPNEVLCRIGGVAICGSDPEIVRGDLAGNWPPSYPFIAGHEWAGRVIALGPQVSAFKIGDRVAGEAHKGCGFCKNCLAGRYTLCYNYGNTAAGHRHYGFKVNGAYAQYAVYHIQSLTPLPDNVSWQEGAMCDTAGVALHGLELSGITPGGTVAVIGPGPIGMMAMKLARAMGAARLIVVGRGSRLKTAQSYGCDDAVDFTTCDPVSKVRELTGELGVDECFECSGAPGTFVQAVRMVHKGGVVTLLGVATDDVMEPLPFKYVTHNEITIHGSRANPNVSGKVLSLISRGNIVVRDMVTHTYPLEKFAEGLETFVKRKDNVMKVVFLPNGENA